MNDNCPSDANPDQANSDGLGTGDACEDPDGDLIASALDNCPGEANPIQEDADEDGVPDGARVLIVDDLLATGGTARASVQLLEECGAQVIGLAFLVNLAFLPGAGKLADYTTQYLVEYDGE